MLALTKVLVESLNVSALAAEVGPGPQDEKSIAKLERFFRARGYPEVERDVTFLRDLQALKSAAVSHGKGTKHERLVAQLGVKKGKTATAFERLLVRGPGMLDSLLTFYAPPCP